MGVPGIEPGSSARAISVLNHGAISPAPLRCLVAEGWDFSVAYVRLPEVDYGLFGEREMHKILRPFAFLASILSPHTILGTQHRSRTLYERGWPIIISRDSLARHMAFYTRTTTTEVK